MIETGHWITIVVALASLAISVAQAFFWFEIKSIHRRIDAVEIRNQDVGKQLAACRLQHDSNAATKSDVLEIKGAVSSLHRRIDELYRLLLERTQG